MDICSLGTELMALERERDIENIRIIISNGPCSMDSKAEISSVLNIFARCSLAMFLKTSWGATSPGVLEAKQIFDACDQNQAPGRSQHTGGLKGGLNP